MSEIFGGGGGGTTSPLTTKGDIWVYDSADTRLPIGTNGYRLQADSTDAQGMIWAPTDIGCRVRTSADFAVANATWTDVTFDTETYDTDTMHSTSANTERITFTTAGKYLIGGGVFFDSNASGYRVIGFYLNNATYIMQIQDIAVGAGIARTPVMEYTFAAADYVTLRVYQNSGGSLNLLYYSPMTTSFWARKVDRSG